MINSSNKNIWGDFLESILKNSTHPVLYSYINNRAEIISANNLWVKGLHRRHQWRSLGIKPHDVICIQSNGATTIEYMVAAAKNNNPLWIVNNNQWQQLQSNRIIEKNSKEPRLVSLFNIEKNSPNRAIITSVSEEVKYLVEAGANLILTSSGTTGTPKIIGYHGNGIIHQLKSHYNYITPLPETCRLCILPQSHAFGLILDLLLGIYSKQVILFEPTAVTNIKLLWQRIINEDIRYLAVVPRILELLIRSSNSNIRYLNRINLHVGGGIIRKNLLNSANNIFEKVILGYGLSECGPGVLINGDTLDCQVKIDNLGYLWVKSHSQAIFKEAIYDKEGYYFTGDLATFYDNKYYITGRGKDTIKTTCGKITNLVEIEQQLLSHSHIISAKINYTKLGYGIKLIVEPDSNPESLKENIEKMLEKKLGFNPSLEIEKLSQEKILELESSYSKEF
jgi:long-subunit acyl-CoA synthetase (AMP-forming)